jgi:hypothetical protein
LLNALLDAAASRALFGIVFGLSYTIFFPLPRPRKQDPQTVEEKLLEEELLMDLLPHCESGASGRATVTPCVRT